MKTSWKLSTTIKGNNTYIVQSALAKSTLVKILKNEKTLTKGCLNQGLEGRPLAVIPETLAFICRSLPGSGVFS